jgi:crotonobetainyl-CoA:carnitine CoA-transferase CaiB-like acyl-CoA transferase
MILRDIKLLDFTRLLPGPLATGWMAEAGAQVIKIDDPERPDGIKDYSGPMFGNPRLDETLNGLKTIFGKYPLKDLSDSPEFMELLASADVLVEQFKPGLMDKLGLGYEALKIRNPRLIYISLSGFGNERPEPGHDLNFVAESGLLDLMRDEQGNPVIPKFQLGDVTGSFACYTAVLEGLVERGRTGLGCYKQVNMTSALLPFLTMTFRFSEVNRTDMAGFLSGNLPNYAVYRCADGEFLAVGALEFHLWRNACEALGLPEELRNAYNNPSMKNQLQDFFLSRESQYWLKLTEGKNTCISPVVRVGTDLFSSLHQNMITPRGTEEGDSFRVIRSPFGK